MDDFLKQLAERLRIPDSEIVAGDEVKHWPDGKLDQLVAAGILTEIEHAKGVVCDRCEENCYIEPDIRTYPDGSKTIGVFVCTRNPDIGRFEVDLNRLRQWRINKRKLWQLVYGVDSEWQVPWDDDNSEYIPLQEAVNLANDDSITVKSMSRLLKEPDFPVHRMHKGRRCKIHLDEFRTWLRYAQHGKISDKAIENYLAGVQKRRECTRQKKLRKKAQQPRQ